MLFFRLDQTLFIVVLMLIPALHFFFPEIYSVFWVVLTRPFYQAEIIAYVINDVHVGGKPHLLGHTRTFKVHYHTFDY